MSSLLSGRPLIVEDGLDSMVRDTVAAGRLRMADSAEDAVLSSDISIVCVGTPSRPDGSADEAALRSAAWSIGQGMARKNDAHLVVLRSTIPPGTTRRLVTPILEQQSRKQAGTNFDIVFNPEFLREGCGVADFLNPPKIVVGGDNPAAIKAAVSIYDGIDAPVIRTTLEEAEMVKYADNAWHALKITFANEIGNLCSSLGIDGHRVMDAFVQDRKLNISSAYLKPGFAFGGSCLGKDLRALTYLGQEVAEHLPMLRTVLPANDAQINRAVEKILSFKVQRIAIIGIAFKSGTDDLRESPYIPLVRRLLKRGLSVRVHDPLVEEARKRARNGGALSLYPDIEAIFTGDIADCIDSADLVVVGNAAPAFGNLEEQLAPGQHLLDLNRVDGRDYAADHIHGLNW